MKDPNYSVRKAIYSRLNGNISYNAVNVPVYNRVEDAATYPYILLISDQATETDQNRSDYNNDALVNIEVVTRFDSDDGGQKVANLIMNDITVLMRTRTSGYLDLSSDGFKCYGTVSEGINHLEESLSDHYYFRSILTMRFKVNEL